jgi:hypothetical protein
MSAAPVMGFDCDAIQNTASVRMSFFCRNIRPTDRFKVEDPFRRSDERHRASECLVIDEWLEKWRD